MNCKQANENISIKEVMESFSLFPSKEHPKTAYYYAINRQERTPSLLVNYVKNIAFDFGTGMMYDNVSIVQAIKRCSVSDALEYLSRFDFSYKKQSVTETITAENTNQSAGLQQNILTVCIFGRHILQKKSFLQKIVRQRIGRGRGRRHRIRFFRRRRSWLLCRRRCGFLCRLCRWTGSRFGCDGRLKGRCFCSVRCSRGFFANGFQRASRNEQQQADHTKNTNPLPYSPHLYILRRNIFIVYYYNRHQPACNRISSCVSLSFAVSLDCCI